MPVLDTFLGDAFKAAEEAAKDKGLDKLASILHDAGFTTEAGLKFAEDNPYEALAGFLAAAAAVYFIGPEALAEGAEKLAGNFLFQGIASVFGEGTAEILSSVVLDNLIGYDIEGAFKTLSDLTDTLLFYIGGTQDAGFNTQGGYIGISPATGDKSLFPTLNSSTGSLLQNFDGGTSEITLKNPDGSSFSTTYNGPNGTGSATYRDAENIDGSSILTFYNPDGSSFSTTYSGANGTGSATFRDVENADGSSVLSTYHSDGSSVSRTYSGPNGTGTITFQDEENANGTSSLTTYNNDGSSLNSTYSGPNGTGSLLSQDQESPGGPSVLTSYNPTDGSSISSFFTGPNGTGNLTETDQENGDGSSQITTYGPNGSSEVITYSGPHGTGDVLSKVSNSGGTVTSSIEVITSGIQLADGSYVTGSVNISSVAGSTDGQYPFLVLPSNISVNIHESKAAVSQYGVSQYTAYGAGAFYISGYLVIDFSMEGTNKEPNDTYARFFLTLGPESFGFDSATGNYYVKSGNYLPTQMIDESVELIGGINNPSTNVPVSSGSVIIAANNVACYASGTKISTSNGDKEVNKLNFGNDIVLADGGLAPVRWIGTRVVNCQCHPRPQEVWPVRIRAHAFASDLPCRDLLLSPDHAVLADGVLVPIRCLVNGSTIAQEPVDEVTYYHVELARHDVILAERLPCESYLDTDNRKAFANGGTVAEVHPTFAPGEGSEAIWEAAGYAPLRIAGEVVDGIATRLRRRAAELGYTVDKQIRPQPAPLAGATTTDLMELLQPAWYLTTQPRRGRSRRRRPYALCAMGRPEGGAAALP